MKPLIILIHGFCESDEIWDFVADELSVHFDVKTVNLPGFGGTSLGEIKSLSEVANWLKNELPENRLLYLVGHSLGGYVSLEFLRRFPKRLAGLCLFHSTSTEDSEEKKENRERTISFVEKNGKESFLKQFVNSLFASEFLRENFGNHQKMDRIALQTPVKVIIEYTRWMKDRPAYTELLAKSELPILFIAGDQDQFIAQEVTFSESERVPDSKMVVLKDCGHLGMLEAPQRSSEALISHINAINF